jgi:hypothetical protein
MIFHKSNLRNQNGICTNFYVLVICCLFDGEADDTTRCDDRGADDQRSWMTLCE